MMLKTRGQMKPGRTREGRRKPRLGAKAFRGLRESWGVKETDTGGAPWTSQRDGRGVIHQ